jgi:uncharacterized protein (TIGR02145 family)
LSCEDPCELICENDWEELDFDNCECVENAFKRCQNGILDGNEEEFDCGGDCNPCNVTDYDGNTYLTTRIGSQVWMAENLKVTHYADGTMIPYVEDQVEWFNLSSNDKGFCYYNNDSMNREIFGALYTWSAAMNGANSSDENPSGIQGVCPTGWHVPSDAEWKELEMNLGLNLNEANAKGWRGTDTNVGGQLKETGTDYWVEPNTKADNSSGFAALPGGVRDLRSFIHINAYGYWWSSTESGLDEAWCRNLYHMYSAEGRWVNFKRLGHSIRCVKDE